MRSMNVAAMAVIFFVGAGFGQPSAAALLSISGMSDLSVPAANDLIGSADPAFRALVPGGGGIDDADNSGLFSSAGANLSTTADAVSLNYHYIGSLAAATNSFSAGGNSFESRRISEARGGDSVAQPSFTITQALAGFADFSFASRSGRRSVVNGANNPVAGAAVDFLLAYLEPMGGGDWEITDTPTNTVLLLFEDGGPARNPDHDDLGVIVVATPIPGALPLILTALSALGVMVWRRNCAS